MFHPNFVTFTNTDIVDRRPLGGEFKGNQNAGFTYVTFADGSGGLIKTMKDWVGNKTGRLYPAEILAAQEYLAGRVGKAMNAPIRDCLFIDSKNVVMPYIIGENLEQAGKEMPLGTAQATVLALFDYLVANADRRPKNVMQTLDKRIVGIDHALCNFRPRTASPELIAQLWNGKVTHEALLILKPKLQNLAIDFHQLGMGDKHETMMANLSQLIDAFQILNQYAVITKGDVQGHPFHGNQYEDGQGGGSPHLSFIANKASKFYASGGTVTVYTRQGQEVGEVFGEMKKLQAERDRIAEQPGFTTKNMEWRRLAEVTGAHERAGRYGNDLLVARNAGGEIVAAMDVRYVGGTLHIGVVGALEGSNGAGTALELEAARYITSKVENSSKRDGGIESTTEFGSEGYHQALGRNFMQWQSAHNPSNPAEGKWVPTDTPKEGNKSFWTPEQVKEIANLDVASKVITKGDLPNHEFHGNQWVDNNGHVQINEHFPYGKEGSDEGAKIPPSQVAKILGTQAASVEINRLMGTTDSGGFIDAFTGEPALMNSPLFGGCLLTAQALKVLYPDGEIKASLTTSRPHLERGAERGETPLVQHFVLSIGKDRFLDARGEITEIHAANLTESRYGDEIVPLYDDVYGNHLVEATPKIIEDAQKYMISPPGAAEKFADWILQQAGQTVSKGDLPGHVFHGNQYQAGTGVIDEISPHRMKYLTELYIGTFRYKPQAVEALLPAAQEEPARQQAFAFELNERLSGKTLLDSDSGPARMYRRADEEMARGAVDDVDDFMKGISQFAKPTGGTIARGVTDPTGEIAKSLVEGSTIDLPISSWANRMGGGKPLDEAASWGEDIVLVVDNPETKAFSTNDVVSLFPQSLTGGRFSVDKIVDSVSGYSGRPVKTVFLTQQEFYAKAARIGWKQSHPNFWPNWFPDDFDPHPAFTEIAMAPVQKGDLPGHVFHGNQWQEGWSLGSQDGKTFTLVSENGNRAVFSKANDGWSPETAKRILSLVDKQATGMTIDFLGKNSTGEEYAHVPLDQPDTLMVGSKGMWDKLIEVRGSVFAKEVGEIANDPEALSRAMRRYDALVAKSADYGKEDKYGDNFVSPIGITKAIITHELGHSDYLTSDKNIGDIYEAVSKATSISPEVLGQAEADGYKTLGSQKDLFGRTAMQITSTTVKTDGVAYDKATAFGKWGLAPLPYNVSSALQEAGMTKYGSRNLAEMTAEAYAMYQNTNITPTPLVSSLAETLGWSRPTAKSEITKGDVQGHVFHGNQWTGGISFHSFDEATKWFSERNIKLDTKAIEANGGLPSDVARIANQIDRIETKFPDSLRLLSSITAQVPEGRPWLARVGPAGKDTPERELQLSPKFFAISQNNDVLKQMIQERADAGKPPFNIARNADDMVAHELAHVFQHSISKGLEGEPTAALWQGANRLWGGKVPSNFYDDSRFGDSERSASIFERAAYIAGYVKADGDPKTQLAKDVSPYALTKPSEMWGEVFALFQRPDGISTLPKGAQERITKFQTAVNELAGSVILKAVQQDSEDVTCDMGFPEEFWTQFNELVKNKKSKVEKGDFLGHIFHGNQWVSGHSATEKPRKWAKSVVKSLIQGKRPIISAPELSILFKQAAKDPAKVATVDITELRVNGTALMGEDGLGIPRKEMPQIPSRMREKFIADLAAEGITSTKELVDPTTLQPSQMEIGLGRAAELFKIADGEIPQTKFILASQDDYIIDGHHNWAADVAIHLTDPTQMLPIIRVNAPALQVIDRARVWSQDNGIANKPLGKSLWSVFTSILKGDRPGHPFHGNQYEEGEGGGSAVPNNPRSSLIAPIMGDEVRFSDQFLNAQKATDTLISQGKPYWKIDDEERGQQKAAIAKDIAARLSDKFDEKLIESFNADKMTHDFIWRIVDGVPRQQGEFDEQTTAAMLAEGGIRGDDPRVATALREEAVSQLISLWAGTSNDSSPKSLALQEAAKDEFGLKGAADWESPQSIKNETDAEYAKNGDLYKAFLRAQYENTQEYLAKGGIKELGLYRGVISDSSSGDAALTLRPLSSWAYRIESAKIFTFSLDMNSREYVLAATVPADRVLSCARTGIGCLNEAEVVVLGGEKDNIANVDIGRNSILDLGSTVYAMKPGGDYSGVDFSGVRITTEELSNANFSNAILDGKFESSDFTNANFSNATLAGAWFSMTELPMANFTGADLANAKFITTKLQGANFTNASLVGTSLFGSNLTNADLRNANLTNANLSEADLTGANLTGVDLTGTKGDELTKLPPTHKVVDGFVVEA